MAKDVYNLTAGNVNKAVQGKDTSIGRDASRFVERYSPGTNLWQTRLLTQRLLWNNLQRLLDVDAEESFRRQAAAPKRWGGEYWWAPGELAPGSGSATSSDELGLSKAERRELMR